MTAPEPQTSTAPAGPDGSPEGTADPVDVAAALIDCRRTLLVLAKLSELPLSDRVAEALDWTYCVTFAAMRRLMGANG